jgi:hypothetical protein
MGACTTPRSPLPTRMDGFVQLEPVLATMDMKPENRGVALFSSLVVRNAVKPCASAFFLE